MNENVIANFVIFYYSRRKPDGSSLTTEQLSGLYEAQGRLLEQLKSGEISYEECNKEVLTLEKTSHWRENTFIVHSPIEVFDCLKAVNSPSITEAARMAIYAKIIRRFIRQNHLTNVVVFTLTVEAGGSVLCSVGAYDYVPETTLEGSIANTSINDHYTDSWTKELTLAFYTFMAENVPQVLLSENAGNLLAGLQ